MHVSIYGTVCILLHFTQRIGRILCLCIDQRSQSTTKTIMIREQRLLLEALTTIQQTSHGTREHKGSICESLHRTLRSTECRTFVLIWLDICCVICLIVADGGVYSLSVQLTTRETTYRCVFSTLMRRFLPNANVH